MPYLKLDRRTSWRLALARRHLGAATRRIDVEVPTPTGPKRLRATIVHGRDTGGSAVAAAAVGRTVIVRRTSEAIVLELNRQPEAEPLTAVDALD